MEPRIAFRIAGVALLLYLAFFVLLSMDALVRLWMMRSRMDSPLDAALLFSYQTVQATATLAGMVLAARVLRRSATTAARAFTLFLIFATLAYTKAFGFASFPGPLQSWIAARLFDAGFPRTLSNLIFGMPSWAVWFALAAFLRVSVTFPRAVSAEMIAVSGRNDRTGLMRSVALAGVDVGALSRKAAAVVVSTGLLRGLVVWPAAATLGLAPLLFRIPGAGPATAVVFGVATAIGVAALRAGSTAASRLERRRLLWMVQAGLSALIAFAVVGVLSLAADPWAGAVSFAIAAAAPLAVLGGIALGTRGGRPPAAQPAIHRTLVVGGVALASAIAYIAAGSAVIGLAGDGAPSLLLALTAALLAGLLVSRPIATRVSRSAW